MGSIRDIFKGRGKSSAANGRGSAAKSTKGRPVRREVCRRGHPRWGEVEVVKSTRARRISLMVRADGSVKLTMPYGVEVGRAWAFMESRTEWVEQARAKVMANRQNRAGAQPMSEQELAEERERLRVAAKGYLPNRVAELSAQTGLQCGRVSIRASRTRWGSCSARNDINLSLYLMRLPAELIDFVILHELCHVRHKNHSAQFHALLNTLCGGREKELSARLKQERI